MAKIISVHSFRGGTGKSNTSANIATLLALGGRRVGVVDTDLQSPGIHMLFGLREDQMNPTLNDYLRGTLPIAKTAHDLSGQLQSALLRDASVGNASANGGRLYLVPSSIKTADITQIVRTGYDPGLLNDGFQALVRDLDLDILVIDTHPGVSEETLLSIAISDALAIVLRPDEQDFQGTAVTVELARILGVPRMLLVVNKLPSVFNVNQVRERVQDTFNCEVAGILPHSDEIMTLMSAGLFVLRYPNHPITQTYRQISAKLVE